MGQILTIHPENPQPRLIQQVVDCLNNGGVIIYPTDSAYALGCHLDDKQAVTRLRRIRGITDKHHLTLICKDLAELGSYARVTNTAVFRLLKAHTPGPYTFLLKATDEVPRRLSHPKRKSIGLRIPDNKIAQAILAELHEPLLSSSLILPGEEEPMVNPEEIFERIGAQVDLVIDGGFCGFAATSVIDLYDDKPIIIRRGIGDLTDFE